MFNSKYLIIFIFLIAQVLHGCAERPTETRVNRDFVNLNEMLGGLDDSYENCNFIKETISPKKEQGRDEGWQVFVMKVRIICDNSEKKETVRILYEYVIDTKEQAGPYWRLAAWGYDRPFAK
jgi:hypothetical protein